MHLLCHLLVTGLFLLGSSFVLDALDMGLVGTSDVSRQHHRSRPNRRETKHMGVKSKETDEETREIKSRSSRNSHREAKKERKNTHLALRFLLLLHLTLPLLDSLLVFPGLESLSV